MKPDTLMGYQSGLLTVIAPASPSARGSRRYFVRCRCRRELLLYENKITGAQAFRSCGCKGRAVVPPPWTEDELAILRTEYPRLGYRTSEKLLNRDPVAVRRKAGQLGVRYQGPFYRDDMWTEEDDALLREHYPKGGSIACLDLFPSRSKTAISDRAYLLKIKCEPEYLFGLWSEREVSILRKHYYRGGTEGVHKHLPERSLAAIAGKVTQLGLKMRPAWTKKEDREFKKLYVEGGSLACAERWPKRTKQSLRSKARELGVRYRYWHWNDDELEILKREYPLGGWRAVNALLPHRNSGSIWSACRDYGVRYIPMAKREETP